MRRWIHTISQAVAMAFIVTMACVTLTMVAASNEPSPLYIAEAGQ